MNTEVDVKEESPTLPSPTTTNTQHSPAPSTSPSRPIRRTVAQRRAYLRDDPLSGELEPHRVFCRGCQKWIKLGSNTEYALANWQTHMLRCPRSSPSSVRSMRQTPSKPAFSPSSRVSITERKIVLLNDPQVRTFSKTHVQCGCCKTEVALEGEVDYDLTKWAAHKETCIPSVLLASHTRVGLALICDDRMTPAPITPEGSRPCANPPHSTSSTHSHVSAGRPGRSPTPTGSGSSSNTTETTAVAESPESPAAVKVGVKRGRDEETEEVEVAEDIDERPINRRRTETYKPPRQDVPNLFGWLMHPLKEFARGFREGLSTP